MKEILQRIDRFINHTNISFLFFVPFTLGIFIFLISEKIGISYPINEKYTILREFRIIVLILWTCAAYFIFRKRETPEVGPGIRAKGIFAAVIGVIGLVFCLFMLVWTIALLL